VAAVSVAVCAVVLLIVTEAGERLHVVGLAAPEGEVVIAQVRVTAPVNEFAGVTVMVEAPLAPGLTEMTPLLVRVKLVLLPPPGACQKSPQPARRQADKQTATGAAASNHNRAHLPIFIFTPWIPAPRLLLQGIALARTALFPRRARTGHPSLCKERRASARIRSLRTPAAKAGLGSSEYDAALKGRDFSRATGGAKREGL
jgi:hypothetical protein